MSFLYPQLLYALFLITIPILIHLFHFRRFKKVYFSNTAFVKLIKKEKRTKNQLRNLIILLLRILIVASIVFAFSQPYKPSELTKLKSGKKTVSLYIDNSLSMENLASSGNLFVNAKEIAEQIVNTFEDNDEFQLITNDLNIEQNRFYTKQQILEEIPKTKITSSIKKIETIYDRQKQLLSSSTSKNKISYLISDFQKSSSQLEAIKSDTTILSYLVPITPLKENNIYIDSAWFDRPILQYNQAVKLNVRIVNASERDINDASIYFKLNGKQKGISNFQLKSNEQIETQLVFTLNEAGWNKGILEIEDYPMIFDDKYYISFNVKENIEILEIYQNKANPFLRTVYSTDDYLKFLSVPISNLKSNSINKYDLLIINELDNISSGLTIDLIKYINDGGNLLVIPSMSDNSSKVSYNNLLSQLGINGFDALVENERKVSYLNSNHNFFKGLFEDKNFALPLNNKYYSRLKSRLTNEITLLGFDRTSPLLSFSSKGKGNIFISSSPIEEEWTNFMTHSIFVISMYQVALYQIDHTPISYQLNTSDVISLDISLDNELIKLKNDETEFIPGQDYFSNILNISIDENFMNAGYYNVIGDQQVSNNTPSLAFNYNRSESSPDIMSSEELKIIAKEKGYILLENLGSKKEGNVIDQVKESSLWKLFILFALFFLLIEIILLRVWK